MIKQALQNKAVGVVQMAFRARKVYGTFGKWAPDLLQFFFQFEFFT